MSVPIRLHSLQPSYPGWMLFVGLLLVLIILSWIYVLYVLINRFYGYRIYSNILANYTDNQVRQYALAAEEWLKASIMFALILTITGIVLIPAILYGMRTRTC